MFGRAASQRGHVVRWEFNILGPLEVRRDGAVINIGAAQQRAVLAALLLEPDRVVSTSRLIECLWGEDPPPTARATLQSLIKRLRRALVRVPGEPYPAASTLGQVLMAQPPGYRIVIDPDAVDVSRFCRLELEGRRALAAGEVVTAGEHLRAALALWRGEALLDVSAKPLRRRALPLLVERYLGAVEARLEADLQSGQDAEIIAELLSLVAEHPLRESLHRLLMTALQHAGRRAEALEAYWSLRQLLGDSLGVEPDQATRQLHGRIAQAGTLSADVVHGRLSLSRQSS
jgi:DNA-binding SARP family transcriptional activator